MMVIRSAMTTMLLLVKLMICDADVDDAAGGDEDVGGDDADARAAFEDDSTVSDNSDDCWCVC